MKNADLVAETQENKSGLRFLLVEILVMSADLQQVIVHIQVIQIFLSIAQSLVDQQVHGG